MKILRSVLKGLLLVAMVSWLVFAIMWSSKEVKQVRIGLPKLNIQLNDVTLEDVNDGSKNVKYDGNKLTVDWQDKIENYKNVELKGHGNTAWEAEKKSYRIKFAEKVDLCGIGKSKKWVLTANYDDDSMLRNDVGLFISHIMSRSPIDGKFVLLSVDDEDLGVYYLTQALSVDKKMVDLHDPYGLLVEYDGAYGDNEELYYETKNNGFLTVKDAAIDDNAEVALNNFGKVFDELERAAEKHDYKKIEELIDVQSFADYFIISEFTGDPDAYLTSFYMYKDGRDDKIHSGIGWDFDAAFGNRNWGSGSGDFYLPTTMMARRGAAFSKSNVVVTRLFYYLIEIPEFYELVCNTYQEKLMWKKEDILGRIDEIARLIRDEAVLDSEKWGKKDFDTEVDYLKWWIEVRFTVFDEIYGGLVRTPMTVRLD